MPLAAAAARAIACGSPDVAVVGLAASVAASPMSPASAATLRIAS